MNKLTRKLLISVFTLAFALVTLGATTFAWFTLTSTAAIDAINVQVVAGEGIEISGDGTNYRNQIPLSEIFDNIGINDLDTRPMLDAVTTSNGYLMKNLEGTSMSTGYVEFDLYFRSPTEGARVYFGSATSTSSTAKTWIPDVTFRYRGEGDVSPAASVPIYAADSLRFSFEEYEYENDSFAPLEVREPKIFELNPSNSSTTNLRLDKQVNLLQGLVPYWATKTDDKPIPGLATVNDNLPVVLSNNALGTVGGTDDGEPVTPLLTLTENGEDGYFYSYARIRLWLEGWDPDNFDAVLNANFSITFSFNVAPAETDIDPEV